MSEGRKHPTYHEVKASTSVYSESMEPEDFHTEMREMLWAFPNSKQTYLSQKLCRARCMLSPLATKTALLGLTGDFCESQLCEDNAPPPAPISAVHGDSQSKLGFWENTELLAMIYKGSQLSWYGHTSECGSAHSETLAQGQHWPSMCCPCRWKSKRAAEARAWQIPVNTTESGPGWGSAASVLVRRQRMQPDDTTFFQGGCKQLECYQRLLLVTSFHGKREKR